MNGFEYFAQRIQGLAAGEIASRMGSETGWYVNRTGIWNAAYHEAGHCICDWLAGKRPYAIEIYDNGGGRVCYSEAGKVKPLSECKTDREKIGECTLVLTVCNQPPDLDQFKRNTEDVLRDHWVWVRRLAHELVNRWELHTADLEELLADLTARECEEEVPCLTT